jgi:hypothetical protein
MKNLILFIMIVFLLLIFAAFFLSFKNGSGKSNSGVACTMDAMQCPDGSYVGRIPPDCEFAPCP